MSIGAVLVGIAALAVVAAYLARPFRPAATMGANRMIEAWVSQVQTEDFGGERDLAEQTQPAETLSRTLVRASDPARALEDDQAVDYCPQCGRRVHEDDRFCSGCGTQLRRGSQ